MFSVVAPTSSLSGRRRWRVFLFYLFIRANYLGFGYRYLQSLFIYLYFITYYIIILYMR